MRAVVIDDDADFVAVMREALELAGVESEVSTDPDAAFELVLQTLPDLVTLDIRMRGSLTGLSILERIRAHPKTAEIPIIICTGLALRDVHLPVPTYRVRVITKPFDLQKLLKVVR